MLRLHGVLVTTFAMAVVSSCLSQTPGDPQYVWSLIVPYYQGRYVLDWDAPQYTTTTVYGPDTKPVYSLPQRGPGDICYPFWAIDSDGTAARAYRVHGSQSEEGRIDLLNGTGKLMLTIKTGLYLPQRLVFAPDHTLWSVGYAGDSRVEDFPVLHHYARTGEELGEILPWSQIQGEHNAATALQGVMGGRWLFASSDRLGFVSLQSYGHNTWVEVGYGGQLLGTYDLGTVRELVYEPLAMTANNDLYARIWKESKVAGWAVLDWQTKSWHKITGVPKGKMIGTEGDSLIFSQQEGGWTVLHAAPSGSLRIAQTAEASDIVTH